jgi:hypothetical protein
MFDHEEPNEAWRLYFLNWVVLSAIGLLLGVSIAISRFSLEIESGLLETVAIAATFTLVGLYLISHSWGATCARWRSLARGAISPQPSGPKRCGGRR